MDKFNYPFPVRFALEIDVPHTKFGTVKYIVNLLDCAYDNEIGRVCLRQIGEDVLETHSRLHDSMHNQGYGALMYCKAIHFGLKSGYRVCSSPLSEMTDLARRLWWSRKLDSEFDIKNRNGRWWASRKGF